MNREKVQVFYGILLIVNYLNFLFAAKDFNGAVATIGTGIAFIGFFYYSFKKD